MFNFFQTIFAKYGKISPLETKSVPANVELVTGQLIANNLIVNESEWSLLHETATRYTMTSEEKRYRKFEYIRYPRKSNHRITKHTSLYKPLKKKVYTNNLQVQTSDECSNFEKIQMQLASIFQGDNTAYTQKLCEDVALLIFHLTRANGKIDIAAAIITFSKLRTNDPILSLSNAKSLLSYFKTIFGSLEVQSLDDNVDVTDTFAFLRSYLDKYEEIKNSPIFKKVYKFAMYALSLDLFRKVGITFDTLRYAKLEQEVLKKQYVMNGDFIHTLLDTLLFLCERGYQCMRTGSLDPIYHSGSSYEAWYDSTSTLKINAKLLAFPEAHGFDRFSFLADLRTAIEKGDAIYKHAIRLGEYERKTVRTILNDLRMILADETTKRSAQKERKAPFAVLLYGGSSIGKSTLTKMLFYQYAKTMNLPTDSEFKYTRNANDPFWSGFNSSQWCVQLDDIAFMHPSKAVQGDPSLMEMLQVVNNVPFIPNQADLADKGRTPVRCELVIATTNCEDLNIYQYFQTPLAVQRRLPFVIDVTPKPEFARADATGMLDSTKTQIEDGKWPDYWQYIIKKVVPASTKRERQQGRLEVVHTFTNSDDLLSWFSKESIKHNDIQRLVQDCDDNMSQIELCTKCYYTISKCKCIEVQTVDEFGNVIDDEIVPFQPVTWSEYFKYYFLHFIIKVLCNPYLYSVLCFMLQQNYIQRCLENHMVAPAERMKFLRSRFNNMGTRVENIIGRNITCKHIAVTLVSAIVAWKTLRAAYDWMRPTVMETQTSYDSTSANIGVTPVACDQETENVWHKDDFQMTSFDASSMTTSFNSLNDEQIKKILSNGLVHLRTYRLVDGQEVSRVIRATCVSGHIYVCNNHGLPVCDQMRMTIIMNEQCGGVNSNMTISVSECDIFRMVEKDLAFIRIRNLPPRKDISHLFMKKSLGGIFKGFYFGRREDGSIYDNIVDNIKRVNDYECIKLKTKSTAFSGYVRNPTQLGDCGSILIAKSAIGPIILGLHFLGRDNVIMTTSVTQDDIALALNQFDEPHVQGGAPLISSETAPRSLGPLAKQAPVHWIPEGTANIYGSFEGFRAAPKSNVTPTLISESMQKRGYTLQCGKPVMSGWKPKNIALNDMVKPVTKINNEVLNNCVESFTNDILSSLSPEDLAEIVVYDDLTTLNGAPGVKYVDKINRGTSAGNPWKKSKKNFLNEIPAIGNLSEPMEANAEIMGRVNTIIDGYHSGTRYMPVFCAHLKDEAVKFKKVISGKTRVFTGAPFDWSFVVRKYLLSSIRVIQKNRFIFESGPGTNCHSLEWQQIREYLVQHGEGQMIAGDYASFDKSMPPTVILAAFDILRKICKKAGYSAEDLKVVQGIAEDTAFPLVDFFGDLMEFYGSNPSGHPLTVIINGLANSLYMRYCYSVLNPAKHCDDFKKNISLMTYGDDNTMGVNTACPWFTHTSVQNCLAEVGIKYTMADKEAISIPYIDISEVSFLKREWRWDSMVGAYLCPLDEESISKSLTIGVASKTICAEAQAIAIMSSACREYFFYGQTIFNSKRSMFIDVVKEHELEAYVEASTFPSWSELKTNFWKASEHVTLATV